ncbi:KTSC domain-containing protein, partial [Staphylococcus aureus]
TAYEISCSLVGSEMCIRDRGSGAARGPGSVYHYANFSAEEFQAFKDAESIGKHFGAYIKPFPEKYPYHKVAEQQQAA